MFKFNNLNKHKIVLKSNFIFKIKALWYNSNNKLKEFLQSLTPSLRMWIKFWLVAKLSPHFFPQKDGDEIWKGKREKKKLLGQDEGSLISGEG